MASVMQSHWRAQQCIEELNRVLDMTAASTEPVLQRQVAKCAAVNAFGRCVRPVLRTFCDEETANVFEETFYAGLE